MAATLSASGELSLDERERFDARSAAKRVAVGAAAVAAIAGSLRPGIGLALAALFFVAGVTYVVGARTRAGLFVASWVVAVPWLVIRDNRWLAICIVATAGLVSVFALVARSSQQSLDDFSLQRLLNRSHVAPASLAKPSFEFSIDRRIPAVIRGLLLAAPVVWVFGALLGSADPVFGSFISISFDGELNLPSIPIFRFGWFLGLVTLAVPILRLGADRRVAPESEVPNFARQTETSIVLGSVCGLFALFIALRVASFGREFSDDLLRGEVRGGFFQLLWVAALTVAMVLAIRRFSGGVLSGKVRSLAMLVVLLAAAIDGLALLRIAGYVRGSFNTPLRFWSFGFGVWLLVVLALAAVRMWGWRSDRRWFTLALVTSWMAFVLAIAVVNPDERIATYNFDNAPTAADEFIAINPLIWLSDDATETIVENIDVLQPMPNDRFVRMVDHLCDTHVDDGWRDWHWSRSEADDPLDALCR